MLSVRRLCEVVGSVFSDAKVCDCVISAWCGRRYEVAWLSSSCFDKMFCASHGVSSVFIRLADCTVEKQLSSQENWI